MTHEELRILASAIQCHIDSSALTPDERALSAGYLALSADRDDLRVKLEEAEKERSMLLASLKSVCQTGDDCPTCDYGRLR